MKVRELLNEQIKSTLIKLSYEFSCDNNQSNELKRKKIEIMKKIDEQAGKGCFSSIYINSNGFTIGLIIPERELDAIHIYVDDIKFVLKQYLDMQHVKEDDDDRRCDVFLYDDFPKLEHLINFPAIYLTATTSASLKGIHKAIGECDWLSIEKCENIKSSVLGLVILAKKMPVTLKCSSGNLPDWVPILNRHLTGDKDILECQEELITNGLKEFAKL
jgi:hypothetical protein